ncbi:hypothetical protein [Burkholderia sp. Bp8990]|uniref:hypothetical protein n=1 Tax=Burkholderia sp. Bp8990 TaxID=2184552 RepID=UPI001624BFA0|nr:hypothetical protein [Burkholderia sp. Bp8990]
MIVQRTRDEFQLRMPRLSGADEIAAGRHRLCEPAQLERTQRRERLRAVTLAESTRCATRAECSWPRCSSTIASRQRGPVAGQ